MNQIINIFNQSGCYFVEPCNTSDINFRLYRFKSDPKLLLWLLMFANHHNDLIDFSKISHIRDTLFPIKKDPTSVPY